MTTSAAETFAALRFEMRTIAALPDALRPRTLNDAYETQAGLVALLLARRGGGTVGYKIACTNPLAREQLNVPHPLYGRLLSHSTFASPATLDASRFTTRTIEPEFGFQMAADVPHASAPHTRESVAQYVGDAFAGIEIVDHRFTDWSAVGANAIAADNAIHGAWVHGPAFAGWRALDLAAHEARLYVDGVEVRSGTGAAVLDHPLNAVAWLANTLPQHGLVLKAGDYITTGVVCDVYPAQAGQSLLADFGVLGRVELAFTA